MTWGGLNPALTAWRTGIVARFPHRGSQSDGGYADAAHGSSSQHQPDADGTVDAFDCDVNFLGSSTPAGTADERRLAEALKTDFEADPRAQLWIHQREIANRDVDDWRERYYDGVNAHDHHIHFQSRQSKESDGRAWKFTHTDALLREWEADVALTPQEIQKIADAVWEKKLVLPAPDGREVTAGTILRWRDASESDTRKQVLEKLAELEALLKSDDEPAEPAA